MDGIIHELHVRPMTSDEDIEFMAGQFNDAIDMLDYFLSQAYLFLKKYRRLKKIGESDEAKYRQQVEKKRRDIAKIIADEYASLGLPIPKNLQKERAL